MDCHNAVASTRAVVCRVGIALTCLTLAVPAQAAEPDVRVERFSVADGLSPELGRGTRFVIENVLAQHTSLKPGHILTGRIEERDGRLVAKLVMKGKKTRTAAPRKPSRGRGGRSMAAVSQQGAQTAEEPERRAAGTRLPTPAPRRLLAIVRHLRTGPAAAEEALKRGGGPLLETNFRGAEPSAKAKEKDGDGGDGGKKNDAAGGDGKGGDGGKGGKHRKGKSGKSDNSSRSWASNNTSSIK